MVKHYRKPKKFHSKYRFTNILCYVPKRYGIMGERQRRQRAVVDDFKNGNYDDALCQHFERIIKTIITRHTDKTSWVITFVPPSIGYEVEYDWRYRHLAQYLHNHLPEVPIIYYGVSVRCEDSWQQKSKGGRRTIKPGNLIVDQQSFRDKPVILIDDVITTGYSFRVVGDALVAAGATYVTGVILAKTIHPHLPVINRNQNTKITRPSQNVPSTFTLPFPEVATPDQLRALEHSTNETSKPNVKPY